MIKSLNDLRTLRAGGQAAAKKRNSWAFEASMAAMGWTSLALCIVSILNGSWLGGALGLILGFIALCTIYVVAAGCASVGFEKQADGIGYVAVLTALGLFSWERWERLGWVPFTLAAGTWVFHAVRYRKEWLQEDRRRDALPEDLATSLVALPTDLDPRLQAPLDRALADCAALQKTAGEAAATPGAYTAFGIDPTALVDDAHTALREMSRRATAAQTLSTAVQDGASAQIREALDAAVAGLERQADEIRGAREAWLLFVAAQAGGLDDRESRVEGLRRRAEALRAMGDAIREVEQTVGG